MDLFVKLAFAELAAQPVTRLNLNTSDQMLLHYVAKPTPERPREPVVLHSHLESNQRLLTVRTLYLLRNQTQVTYYVKLFHQEGQQVVVD